MVLEFAKNYNRIVFLLMIDDSCQIGKTNLNL